MMKKQIRFAFPALAFLTLVFLGCEDLITPAVEETVRLAELSEHTLTILPAVNGSVTPVGALSVLEGEPTDVSAQADSGYTFYRWERTSGSGAVTFDDAHALSTKVYLAGGDATIQAVIDDTSFVVTVENDGHGSTDLSSLNLTKDVQSATTLTATPGAEYNFANWTVVSGEGITFSPNAASSSVTVTAGAGDATIRANFTAKTYTLTMTSDGNGYSYASPDGSVTSGVARSITASAYPTYVFNGWTKTAGTGTATFANPASASTTVTVTGGNVTIRANFRKATISATPIASWAGASTFYYPENAAGFYVYGSTAYILGPNWTTDTQTVVRKIAFTLPGNPTGSSGVSDYNTISGSSRYNGELIGDGSYLIANTLDNVYRLPINFTSANTPATPIVAAPGKHIALSSPGYFWHISASNCQASMFSYSAGSIAPWYYQLEYSGFSLESIAGNGYGPFVIAEDNGLYELGGYEFADIDGGPVYTPSSSVLISTGVDMDPAESTRPAFHPDREMLALAAWEPPNDAWFLQVYDSTSPGNLGAPMGTLELSDSIAAEPVRIEDVFFSDYYIFVAGRQGNPGITRAKVWIVDATAPASLTLRGSFEIGGYGNAQRVRESGGYLYVAVDREDESVQQKVALRVFNLVMN